MTKEAWVLQLKSEVAKEDYDGEVLFLTDSEETYYDFLTENLQEATLIFDKEKEIEYLKAYEKHMFEKFGPNAICNFGYTNISKNFDWVPVDVEETE